VTAPVMEERTRWQPSHLCACPDLECRYRARVDLPCPTVEAHRKLLEENGWREDDVPLIGQQWLYAGKEV